jgi:hypothetical protein
MLKYISLKISISFIFWVCAAIIFAIILGIPALYGYGNASSSGVKINSVIRYFDKTLFWTSIASAAFIFLTYGLVKLSGESMHKHFPKTANLFKSPNIIDDREFLSSVHDEILGQFITIGSILLVAAIVTMLDKSRFGANVIQPLGINESTCLLMGGLSYFFSVAWVFIFFEKHIKKV